MTEPKRERPDWWPEWMSEPAALPLGYCLECGQQQYSMSRREDHAKDCSRYEELYDPHPFRPVPWPRTFVSSYAPASKSDETK
jgi:hypothetical protein